MRLTRNCKIDTVNLTEENKGLVSMLPDYDYARNEFGFAISDNQQCLDKLGQLEDIEDKLGIDLITFFKIFEGQDVYIKLNNGEIIEGFSPIIEENLCGIYFAVDGKYVNTIADYGNYYVSPKDYGKTWALSKEELL